VTVTHDFQLVESCDDPSTWSPTGDGAVSANTSNFIEGSAALNIYKPNTTSTYFGAVHEFPSPIDLSNKRLLLVYIYVSEAVRNVIRYVYLKVYDANGNSYTVERSDNIAYNDWAPIYVQQYGTSIDWSKVKKIEIGFSTWSSSQTVNEGDIVVDRIMVGSGFYVLYTTDVNPHRLWELAALDARDKLGLVKRISKYAYYIVAPVYVGNGTDVGALKIDTEVVVLDATQLGVWYYGVITVAANSFLITNDALLVHIARTVYPYGGAGVVFLTNAIFRADNTYYLSNRPGMRHNFATKEFTASGLRTNVMLWLYTPTMQNLNWGGAFALLPGASYVFDDFRARGATLDTLFYLLEGSELVPRNVGEMSLTRIVFAGGRVRVDARATAHVYNPVNFSPDIADSAITGVGTIYIYFDVDIYAIDRYGNPLVGVTIEVYDKDNNLVYSGTTDSNGKVHARLTVYYYWSDGTNTTRTDYNPFTVVIKSGGEIGRSKIIVYSKASFYVTPDNVYAMTTWPSKTLIQSGEPIYLYARITKIDGTPVSGLDVYADVTLPDQTVYTVSFQELAGQPGTYRAFFDQTSLVGHYDYTAYAIIENTRVEARNSFDVGVLEEKIDNALAQLAAIKKMLSRRFA